MRRKLYGFPALHIPHVDAIKGILTRARNNAKSRKQEQNTKRNKKNAIIAEKPFAVKRGRLKTFANG